MRLYFYKYIAPNGAYFDNQNTFVDKIEITRLPEDGFPLFNEEFLKEDDETVYKSGDYDIKISLMQAELSDNNATVNAFFTEDITESTMFLLFMQPDTEDPESWRAGTVDMSTYNLSLTYSQGEYFVTFTVIGILKEAAKYYTNRIYDTPVSGNITFNEYMQLQFTRGGVATQNLIVNNQLNIASKVGFMPIVHAEFHNIGVLETFQFDYHWSVNRWQVLKDLSREFGFFIKCTPYNTVGDFVHFKLTLYFRDQGLGTVAISAMSHNQRYSLTSIPNKYIFVRLARYGQTTDEEETAGMFLNKDDYWCMFDIESSGGRDYFELDTAENVVRIVGSVPPGFDEETPYSDIYFLNFTAYNNTRYNYNNGSPETYIFSRIFGESVSGLFSNNYDVIAYSLIKPELMRRFSGFKKIKDIKISVPNGLNVVLGNVIPVNSVDYVCERITEYSTQNRTANLEVMEA